MIDKVSLDQYEGAHVYCNGLTSTIATSLQQWSSLTTHIHTQWIILLSTMLNNTHLCSCDNIIRPDHSLLCWRSNECGSLRSSHSNPYLIPLPDAVETKERSVCNDDICSDYDDKCVCAVGEKVNRHMTLHQVCKKAARHVGIGQHCAKAGPFYGFWLTGKRRRNDIFLIIGTPRLHIHLHTDI